MLEIEREFDIKSDSLSFKQMQSLIQRLNLMEQEAKELWPSNTPMMFVKEVKAQK